MRARPRARELRRSFSSRSLSWEVSLATFNLTVKQDSTALIRPVRGSHSCRALWSGLCRDSPLLAQSLKLLPQIGHTLPRCAPVRPYAIPPQQAVLVLGETCQRHEEDAFLGPAGFGGDGKHLGC